MFQISALFVLLWASVSSASVLSIKNTAAFDELYAQPTWIVEFYAPWCTHCQKLLPVLDKLSDYGDVRVPVAKVDATSLRDLAERMEVEKYPTIFFKHGNVVGKYDGPRTFEGMSSFVDKMNHEPMFLADTEEAFAAIMNDRGTNVSFVFGLPAACADGASSIAACPVDMGLLDKIVEQQKYHTLFIRREAQQLSVCKYDIHPTSLQARLLYCLRNRMDIDGIRDFVTSNDYPLVSELESHNYKAAAHLNKTMVIAMLDFQVPSALDAAKAALQIVALEANKETPEAIVFGYLDGIRWKKFAKHHSATVPTLLVADHDNERHAIFSLKGVDHSDYEVFFRDIVGRVRRGEVDMQDTVTPSLWQKIAHRMERYSYAAYFLFASPFVFLAVAYFFPHPSKKEKQH